MEALLFEVMPKAGHEDHYFERAAALKPLLKDHAGLLFLDRFKSQSRDGLILSHSHWLDEAAISRWRADATHYGAQKAGRQQHFSDYRLRISHVVSEVRENRRLDENAGSNTYRNSETSTPRYHAIIASTGEPFDGKGEVFSSVNFEGSYLFLSDCESKEHGLELLGKAAGQDSVTSAMLCVISRDYGMFEREEAPQYFPPAKP